MHILKTIGFSTLLGLAFAVAPASALPVVTFALTSDHCTPVGQEGEGGGGCGLAGGTQSVFGNITVTDMGGGTLDFHVTLTNGNMFINTGFPLTIGFNLVANPLITYLSLTSGWGIPGGTSPTQSAGSYHQDGTGFFEYGVLWGQQGGGHGTAGPLDFDINATGLTLASLQKNANGQYFAVDILSGTTGATGNVDASVEVTTRCGPECDVPEPASVALLGIGLFALYGFARRRKH